MDSKKLSVIIPVYNVEKWLARCLDSVLWQSWQNMEIICVDDASPDESAQILETYAKKDARITVLRHERNRGLFRARITGMLRATGDYIAFLDSDDYVSCDWFRPLIEKLEDENADMVLGNTVNADETGKKTYYNYYRSFNRNRRSLSKPALEKAFFEQHGECFIWHTVWNKVYRRSLIECALPYFEKMPEPLVMGEDIAFSSVFYSLAQKLAFADNDCYFYFRHGEASTSNQLPAVRVKKNLQDIIQVFAFVENFLKETGRYEGLEKDFLAFKKKYHVIWSGNLSAAGLEKDGETRRLFAQGFGESALSLPEKHEFYFYEQESEWDTGYEELRRKILYSGSGYVSFDIYDTLIARPFWEPADLYGFIEKECKKVYNFHGEFSKIRQMAERSYRKAHKAVLPQEEDVTLHEIYMHLAAECALPAGVADTFEQKEKELEIRYSFARQSGMQLYKLAQSCGKRIVLISDMYLEEDAVKAVLQKNGYAGYEALFLSSKERKLKHSGKLYLQALKALGIRAGEIIHIGNNQEGDIRSAEAVGIAGGLLPSAVDVFTNRVEGVYTGDAFKDIYCGSNNLFDSRSEINQMPLRCMFAGVANGMFDQPFRKFHPRTTYNADPYYMGYMSLGMHLLGAAIEMYRTAIEQGYETVHFLARDGFVIKQIFDMIAQKKAAAGERAVGSTYFCATRRSLLPCVLQRPEDVYRIAAMTDYRAQTPRSVLEWTADCCKDMTPELTQQYAARGFDFEKKFETEDELFRFLQCLAELSFDREKAKAYHAAVSAAFRRQFAGRCAAFDIGYSGRLQAMICELAGKPVDVFYIHDNGTPAKELAKKYAFKIYNYYNFSPYVSGIVRECMLSETAPSCIRYRPEEGGIACEYEQEAGGYAQNYAINELHRGALDYCRAMIGQWGSYLLDADLRPTEVSVSFENFFINATPIDFSAFSNTWIEDKMYSGYERRSFAETLQWYSDRRPVSKIFVPQNAEAACAAKTRWGRALYYLLFDRKTFFKKLKNRFGRNK